jgi:NAD(P)H dehydrogenase (quinone)
VRALLPHELPKFCNSVVTNRIPETLSTEVLAKMHAPPKPDYPIIDAEKLSTYDAFLFGIPTRYGNFPAQWKVRSLRYFVYPTNNV